MKLRLTAWNVPYSVKGVGGLEPRSMCLPAPGSGREWISMNESAQLQNVLISEQITSIYILWIVWFLWPETDGGKAFVPLMGMAWWAWTEHTIMIMREMLATHLEIDSLRRCPHSMSSLPTKMKTTAPLSSAAIIISFHRHYIFPQRGRSEGFHSHNGAVNQMVIAS